MSEGSLIDVLIEAGIVDERLVNSYRVKYENIDDDLIVKSLLDTGSLSDHEVIVAKKIFSWLHSEDSSNQSKARVAIVRLRKLVLEKSHRIHRELGEKVVKQTKNISDDYPAVVKRRSSPNIE